MELHSFLFIGCYVVLLQSHALSEKTLEKRAISSASNAAKHDEVEGSGAPPSLTEKQKSGGAGADIEWEASGISPDDEDGDVVEGSGAHIDEVGGSGNMPVTSAPVYTPNMTLTTTMYPPFDVNIHESERGPDEEDDVAIEEVPTTTPTTRTVQSWTTTSRRPPLTPYTTEQSPPPTVFEEKRNIPFDALLKPGVLAAVIGGIVVGILAAILLVMFVVYRMRKKDEGSYALDEPKQPPHYSYAYQKAPTKEFYA